MLDHAVTAGFVHPEHRALLLVARDPASVLDQLAAHRPPGVEKPFDRRVI
jgi:predicted Rossmann-fold nucleotide-binding protein